MSTSHHNNSSSSSLFRVVQYESGQTDDDLPIFEATAAGALQILDEDVLFAAAGGAQQECSSATTTQLPARPTTVEHYPDSVFVIHNLLSRHECRRIVEFSEQMGYTEDAPVSLGRNIRRNENCVWIMDERVNRVIFERIQQYLPETVEFQGHAMHGPLGLNRRWRLYKYHPGDVFKQHTDGPWPPAGIDERDGRYIPDTSDGTALTWMTFLIYLNDDFDGGSTKFPTGVGSGQQPDFEVEPTQGSVLVFYHGYHAASKLHEGSLVRKGTKYVARTEVLYPLPPALSDLRGY